MNNKTYTKKEINNLKCLDCGNRLIDDPITENMFCDFCNRIYFICLKHQSYGKYLQHCNECYAKNSYQKTLMELKDAIKELKKNYFAYTETLKKYFNPHL